MCLKLKLKDVDVPKRLAATGCCANFRNLLKFHIKIRKSLNTMGGWCSLIPNLKVTCSQHLKQRTTNHTELGKELPIQKAIKAHAAPSFLPNRGFNSHGHRDTEGRRTLPGPTDKLLILNGLQCHIIYDG